MSVVWGCSDAKDDPAEPVETAANDGLLDSGSWADGGEAEAPLSDPSHWLLSGSLNIIGGELDSGFSHLTIEMQDAGNEPICTQGVSLQSATRVTELPDPDLQLWWEIETEASAEGDCLQGAVANPLPSLSYIGMGTMHPEIEAVLDSDAGASPPGDVEARSVFIALGPEASVWVFGLATIGEEASSPLDEGVSGVGVSDGLWKFSALYSFPYVD